MMSFADTLNKLLQERGLSLKKVSEATGIPRTTLSEWTLGRKPQVSQELVKLARFLDVSLEYLITGKEPEQDLVQDLIKQAQDSFIQLHQGVYRITVEKQAPKKGKV